MQRVAEQMQFKPTDGANFSAIDSSTLAIGTFQEHTHHKQSEVHLFCYLQDGGGQLLTGATRIPPPE